MSFKSEQWPKKQRRFIEFMPEEMGQIKGGGGGGKPTGPPPDPTEG